MYWRSCIRVEVFFKTDTLIGIKTFKICIQSLKSEYVEDKYPYIYQR